MNNEFEVKIRNGEITDTGRKVLRQLFKEFHSFRYKSRITEIIYPWTQVLTSQPLFEEEYDNVELILPLIIEKLEDIIVKLQNEVLAERRSSKISLGSWG